VSTHALSVTEADHVLGPTHALVTLIEYGDFQCPYCGEAYPLLKRVQRRLGDRMRFVFRHFPLAEIHPNAEHAAEATESVAAQRGPEGFWLMHDLIFENQHHLLDRSLVEYARIAGAEPTVVKADLESGLYRQVVRESFLGGARSGVNGTPTLFIDGVRYDARREEDLLVAALEQAAEEEEVRREQVRISSG